MSTSRIAIFGCGGFGREIEPLASVNGADVVFVSDVASDHGRKANGIPIISFAELLKPEHRDRRLSLAIGSSAARREVAARCEREGLAFGSLFSPTFRGLRNFQVGEGAVFCDFTMITSNATIGRQFQCNIYSYVAHDCIIGDFVTFAPGVQCNGNVVIEDDVYVGTGVIFKQGSPEKPLRIGKGAVIGMGAVVTKDVEPGVTVVGNPARPMVR